MKKITKPAAQGQAQAGPSSSPAPASSPSPATSPTPVSSPTKKGRGPALPYYEPLDFLWAVYRHAGSPMPNFAEMADELGLTEQTVRHRLWQLKKALHAGEKECFKSSKAHSKNKPKEKEDVEAKDVIESEDDSKSGTGGESN